MNLILGFDLWGVQLPAPVALAAMALVGYLAGNLRRRSSGGNEPLQSRRELKRAQAVIQQLEKISKEIRMNLATHQASIMRFKDRITLLNSQQQEATLNELCQEAERMLRPTMQLASQIASAYDEIRQQTNLLMSFSEVRTDPLTGLSNRRGLDEMLKHQFALLHRYGNPFAVVIFDIDYFKKVNDEFGHLEGDQILQQFGGLVENCVRVTDIATRYGGEEFVVVLPETDLKGACIFAERMRQRIAHDLPLTVSVGVAEAKDDEETRSLLARSDSALYSAKATGRDRVFVHTGDHISAVGEVIDVEKCLAQAEEYWPELALESKPGNADVISEEQQIIELAADVDDVSQAVRQAAEAASGKSLRQERRKLGKVGDPADS